MEWYKTLNVHQRINAKDCFKLLTGIDFSELSFLFSLDEKIQILYDKLKIEEFDV